MDNQGNALRTRILGWSRAFRQGELTPDDVQERFAGLSDEELAALPASITRARNELDAIRYGMCESGQRGEIVRILEELESVLRA